MLTPAAQRARYSAIYQVIVMIALSGGAAFGGFIIEHWGYTGVFLISSIGRIVAAFAFLQLVRNLRRGWGGVAPKLNAISADSRD